MTQADVKELYERIPKHIGVADFIIFTDEGVKIESSFQDEETFKYRKEILQFALTSRAAIQDIDPNNELHYLRVRSDRREYICIPRDKYFIIVITLPDKIQELKKMGVDKKDK
ncbi:Dynein_light chain [Hexamita inflata]|uniref:Dynein light chain n=1 Tax=Hexamita inflata TaxID=28002 RepID=A0AA86NFM9_9EUKA|nr:Dynein light chain [Hexamita inflata]